MDEDRTQPLPPPPPPPPPQQGPPVPPSRPGWDADEPFYRRHGLAFAIASGVLALLLLLGLVGVGTFAVSSVVARAAHSISQDRQAQPGPGNGKGYGNGKRGLPGGPGQGAGGMKQGSSLARGTVESISASSWTIRTANGTTVTVAITPQTVFGAPATGGSASDFRRGDQVIVLGKRSGDTITAARIVNIGALRSPGTPSPTPTP